MNDPVRQKALSIKLLALDVDGVLTDGKVWYRSAQEPEIKGFNIKDGLGIKLAQRAGIEVAIITGRESQAVSQRARELGIQLLLQGREDKAIALEELLEQRHLSASQVAYMGDDWPDLAAIRKAGLGACPSDAVDAVREISDWISPQAGGNGAVRSLCDLLLDAQCKWQEIAEAYH